MYRRLTFGVLLGDAEGRGLFRILALIRRVLRDILIYGARRVLLCSKANVRFYNGVITNDSGGLRSAFGHDVVKLHSRGYQGREIVSVSCPVKVDICRLLKGSLRMTHRRCRDCLVLYRWLRFLLLLFLLYLFNGKRGVREGARALNRILRVKVVTCGGECLRVPLADNMAHRRIRRTVKRL